MRITDIMADFLDSIRAYEHESGEAIHFDERESSEFVDMYFNGGGKINIEKSNADGENNQKQIMKKYRLKQWYPSLPKNWVVGDVAIPWEKQKYYYHIPNKSGIVFKEEVEDNPDFWELIEQTDLLEEYLDVNTSDIDNRIGSIIDKRIGSIAIEALENIANPLNYLLEEAKKERRTLDAYIAGKLMENPYFYADIAEKALRLIKQTKAMQEELIAKERSKE